ncbi:MAG: exodeoxyribonuclease V subunit gamma [Clostridia bacterium]|nr:exodeoxyribonuclease V subunit gamma [Clostridia bacterium]
MKIDLTQLNKEQMIPVLNTEGAILVTAGAGSGKTRLLTHRIYHIINDLDVKPYNILALTFTNKAANEMKERLEKMGCDNSLWVFTFHALCVRILRKYIDKIGYKSNFTIYAEQEKNSLIKKILKEKGINEDDGLSSSEIADAISDAKTENVSPEVYGQINSFKHGAGIITEVYDEYNKALKRNNALDYDDLLNFAYKLLSEDAEVREYYADKFRYIHIDEFQDTNTVQYEIVKLLASKWGNIFAVGDEDQSIYGWRGANYKNLFAFQRDFEGATTYKLQQNYRSTKRIIALANKVIKNNTQRLDKNLWTENEEGSNVVFYCAGSDKDEAQYVITVMSSLMTNYGYKKSDFALLMRINALTRTFEEKFIQYGVAHKIFGGFKFFDRKEIKDVLAYLKLLNNHEDEESLLRIANFPKRGIGDATLAQTINYARVENLSLFDVIVNIEQNQDLPNSVIKKITPLATVLKCLLNAVEQNLKPSMLTKYTCKVAGIKAVYEEDTEENAEHRMNIKELVHSMEEFEKDNPDANLSDYLQNVSLYSDTDEMDEESDYVTLATIHSAKGLEFKVVFLVGMDEGIFPSSRSVDENDKLEEERRLLYVAITRARERLYVTRAKTRFKFGSTEYCMPSRFLPEMGFDQQKKQEEKSSFYNSYGKERYERSYSKTSYNSAYNADEVPSYDSGYSTSPKLKIPQKTVAKTGRKDVSKFVEGARVRHTKFGEGVITKVVKTGEVCVKVKFATCELMLMLNYAPLELI